METIWKVVEACIIPIITYGGEVWDMTQQNFKAANQILDRILKRILKVPMTTPREALYLETGLLDPESIIKKNRISMESRIKRGQNQQLKEIIKITNKGSWAEENSKLKAELEIEDNDFMESEYHLKNVLSKNMKKHFIDKMKESSENKSKMQYYMEGKLEVTGLRSKYINKLTRNQVSTIMKARTRMLKVKDNYKNGHSDLSCRLCGNSEETQMHILEKCQKLSQMTPIITKDMIFSENVTELKETAKMINERMKLIENV